MLGGRRSKGIEKLALGRATGRWRMRGGLCWRVRRDGLGC